MGWIPAGPWLDSQQVQEIGLPLLPSVQTGCVLLKVGRLKVSGVVPPFPLCFMACKGATFLFYIFRTARFLCRVTYPNRFEAFQLTADHLLLSFRLHPLFCPYNFLSFVFQTFALCDVVLFG